MRLIKMYIRFYKSFNFDYERKFLRQAHRDPWELIEGAWYPYVRIDLERSITTVVGANESGKSHLLDAIEYLIFGKRVDRSDFCRYSHYFSVERGQRRSPDFGGEFEVHESDDLEKINKVIGLKVKVGDRFHLFRENGEAPSIYYDGDGPHDAPGSEDQLRAILPNVFRLDARVPLPASIPLYELDTRASVGSGSRRSRAKFLEAAFSGSWSTADELAQAAPDLYDVLSDEGLPLARTTDAVQDRQYGLGRDLLLTVAKIDQSAFKDLSDAIADEREGYVNGVIQKVNAALAASLNFPRWWAQDREFKLMVSPREYELVFTIRDRTGTDYSFSERSNGLKYFLSYYVQLLAHQPPEGGRPEILLMDEPDAYLSSQGQQDLLKILEEFAVPEARDRADQVVYVTHSPFLINRNAGQRIRVLDKGSTDEGTRVVKDVARNHYEPLRSSLGAFVAETSFIGGANLFVEGLADQVLLAGASSHLLAHGAATIDVLDLNSVTIVPAGSASAIPYLVYLARGRDVLKPPCVVLLDSDPAGNDARRTLARGGPRDKQVLKPEFVVQVGIWAEGTTGELKVGDGVVVQELEDLVPLPVAAAAARSYAQKVGGATEEAVALLTGAEIAAELTSSNGSVFDALSSAYVRILSEGMHIEKVGFAREVVAALVVSRSTSRASDAYADLERNFSLILSSLARVLRRAVQEEQGRRLGDRLSRTVTSFLDDHVDSASRERGRLLLEDVQASVDDSESGDGIRVKLERLRRDFDLDQNLREPIPSFDEFREQVHGLIYEPRFKSQIEQTVVEPASKSESRAVDSTATPRRAAKPRQRRTKD